MVQINNFVLKSNSSTIIIGKEYKSYCSLYNYPCDSKILNIYVTSNIDNAFKAYKLSDIQCKCIVFQFEGKFVSFPLLHSF